MVGYNVDSLSANMENSRNCLRRIARHDETEFSKESIVNSMEKFVKTVNAMDETILVPCRLMDLSVAETKVTEPAIPAGRKSSAPHDVLASENLFDLYNMLNAIKVELLWGRDRGEDVPKDAKDRQTVAAAKKGHVRRPSTASTASTASSASLPSDTESETGLEGSEDSGVDGDECDAGIVGARRTAENFRRHLAGLRRALVGLTDTANALTQRYQADVGAPV